MFEISPVLAGTFDRPDYVPATSNINHPVEDVTATNDVTGTDQRRYSQFDRTASQVSDATMSFGDFMDMINPLQHIPVISSVYRMVTGDTINPISRVAGDILYGAALGGAGAIAGGIGAVADSVMETETGKDVAGAVVASLFGNDQPDTNKDATTTSTQVASTDVAPTNAAAPSIVTPPPVQTVTAEATPETAPAPPATPQLQNPRLAKLNPLVHNKLPYGGALAQLPNYHAENLKMAVSSATSGMRVGNTIYSNRLNNGALAPLETAPAAKVATAPEIPTELPSTPIPHSVGLMAKETDAIPQGLQDDAFILKALGLYRSVAEGSSNNVRN